MTAPATLGMLPAEAVALARGPSVVATLLARLHLVDGIARLHAGAGTIRIGGEEFRGLSDPASGRLCTLDPIEEPRAGVASYIRVGLSGVDAAFVRAMRSDRDRIEGMQCDVLLGLWDPRTGAGSIVEIFPRGRLTAPGFSWAAAGRREWTVTVVGPWSARNVAVDGRLTPSDQQRRFPGDTALDLIGGSIGVRWPIAET